MLGSIFRQFSGNFVESCKSLEMKETTRTTRHLSRVGLGPFCQKFDKIRPLTKGFFLLKKSLKRRKAFFYQDSASSLRECGPTGGRRRESRAGGTAERHADGKERTGAVASSTSGKDTNE